MHAWTRDGPWLGHSQGGGQAVIPKLSRHSRAGLRFIEGEVGDGAVEVDRVADPGDGDGAAEVDRAEPEDQLVAVRPESGRPSVKSRCASYCQSGPY